MEQFQLVIARIDVPYIESAPDHLELRHLSSGAALAVDVDLLEVLDRLREGAVPSLDESRGLLVNLSLFKHRLLAAPASEIRFVGDDTEYLITVKGQGRVALAEVIH